MCSNSKIKWIIVVCAFFLGAQMSFNNFSFSVLLDGFIETFELPQAVLGVLSAVKSSVTAVTGQALSRLAVIDAMITYCYRNKDG